MEEKPYACGFQPMNNHIPVISRPQHQEPIAELPEGYRNAHHQGQPVHAVERVYGERMPGDINGLLEYEPAAKLPVFAVFAQDDPSREYKSF